MAEGGVFLRINGRLPTGQPCHVRLKAWSPEAGAPLKWEIRRLRDAAGYASCDSFQLHHLVKEQRAKWRGFLQDFGLPESSHYGASMCNLSRGSSDAAAAHNAEQEFWFSTSALLACLAHWSHHRKEVSDKARCDWVGLRVLDACMGEDTSIDTSGIPPELLQACTKEPIDQNGKCRCAQFDLASAKGMGTPCYFERLWYQMRLLFKYKACPTLGKFLGMKLLEVSGVVDGQVDTWGDFDWTTRAAARMEGDKKRRRTDPRLRDFVVRAAPQRGDHQTPASVNKSLSSPASASSVSDCKAKELSALRASMHLTFNKSTCVSLIFDGIRFGNPSKEYLVNAVSDLLACRHAGCCRPRTPESNVLKSLRGPGPDHDTRATAFRAGLRAPPISLVFGKRDVAAPSPLHPTSRQIVFGRSRFRQIASNMRKHVFPQVGRIRSNPAKSRQIPTTLARRIPNPAESRQITCQMEGSWPFSAEAPAVGFAVVAPPVYASLRRAGCQLAGCPCSCRGSASFVKS